VLCVGHYPTPTYCRSAHILVSCYPQPAGQSSIIHHDICIITIAAFVFVVCTTRSR
jgi:hypothetical protein